MLVVVDSAISTIDPMLGLILGRCRMLQADCKGRTLFR